MASVRVLFMTIQIFLVHALPVLTFYSGNARIVLFFPQVLLRFAIPSEIIDKYANGDGQSRKKFLRIQEAAEQQIQQ